MTSAFYLSPLQVIYLLHTQIGQSALDALSQMTPATGTTGFAMEKLRVINGNFMLSTESTW